MKDKHSHIIHNYLNGEIDFIELKNQLPDEDFQYWKDTLNLVVEIPVSNFDTKAEFEALIQKRNREAENKFNFSKYLKIAAVLIVLLSGTVLINFYLNPSSEITTIAYNSNIEENKVVLPDNSKVYLNEASSVTYTASKWDKDRTLTLKGEAYFDVEEGKTFTVKTEFGSVQVLGTTFNIYNHKNTFSVTCYTGKVRVNYNNKDIILNPGQTYSNTNNKIQVVKQTKPQWLSEQSVFDATALVEVIKAIEQQKNIRIDINLDKTYTFTGGYQHDDAPEDILKLISETLGISYKKVNENHFELMNN